MQQEIEAKFLNQNHSKVRRKLQQLGGVCKHRQKLMRRTVFDFPDRRLHEEHAWVRLREELDGSIELTLKRVADNALGETFEHPLVVNDYEAARLFVCSLGLEVKGEQESKREVWLLDNVEIMLDEWPWVPPFIEIEAGSERAVKQTARKLGLAWNEAKFGGVTPAYVAEYDITPHEFESLELSMRFGEPRSAALKPR